MSAALLKKSLMLCESSDQNKSQIKKSEKLKARVTKVNKNSVLQSNKKLSVTDARIKLKKKEEILKHNLHMIKEAKKACTVKINKDTAKQIVERATARKNRKPKYAKEENEEGTLFTEEDFKKFEEEYVIA